jgi:hypothetical protein
MAVNVLLDTNIVIAFFAIELPRYGLARNSPTPAIQELAHRRY